MTKEKLKQIIKEELDNFLNEGSIDFKTLVGPSMPTVVNSYAKVMARNLKDLDKLATLWNSILASPGDIAAARETASKLGLAASLASFHARKVKPGESYPSGDQIKSAIESLGPPKPRTYRAPAKKPYGGGSRQRPYDRST